jgi:hypothetical protein
MGYQSRMAITAAGIESKVEEAITFIEAGEYSSARPKLLAALAMLSVVPDGRQGPNESTYDRRAIENLLEQVAMLERASLKMQFTKVDKKAPTSC